MSDEEQQTRQLIGKWLGNGGVTLLEQPREIIIIPSAGEIAEARVRHKVGEVQMPKAYDEKFNYKGKDGRFYSTTEQLDRADEA